MKEFKIKVVYTDVITVQAEDIETAKKSIFMGLVASGQIKPNNPVVFEEIEELDELH